MKIETLDLTAFGPFTDKTLLFSSDNPGLHIVYGPNEAGKSSALRGLKALLYGIEERTQDNFLHANSTLRIGGCISNTEGHQLTFIRRKGRKLTLLTTHEEGLDEQVLTPFLHGVSADLFQTLFGIDHQALVQGGQDILQQKGEVGQALFSAALGSQTLHSVLEQLDDEADSLFRPRGSTQTLNIALKSYATLKKEIREKSLSSRVWDERYRALERIRKELEKIESELTHQRIEVNRLKRFQRVLPKLARYREQMQALKCLNDVVPLSADFAHRHQQVVKALETAQVLSKKAIPRLNELQVQLEGLTINQALIDQAEAIEDLHTQLGGHRKALQDQLHLEEKRCHLLTDAEFILKQIRPGFSLADIESLQPILARRHSISELANHHAVLVSTEKQLGIRYRETETRLKAASNEHQALPETSVSATLLQTIHTARKLGDIDTQIQSTHSDMTRLRTQCITELARLTLWQGDLHELPRLAIPDRETIHSFEQRYETLDQYFQRLLEKQEETVIKLQAVSSGLDEMRRAGAVPTEDALHKIRSERDQSWQQLRSQWVSGKLPSEKVNHSNVKTVEPEVFENQLTQADELSDRLRREADRVHTLAGLQAEQAAVEKRATYVSQQLEVYNDEKHQMDADWKEVWSVCQIQPRSPREMRAWMEKLEKLRDQVEAFQSLQKNTEILQQTRQAQLQLLNQQLSITGQANSDSEILETALLRCEAMAQQFDEIKQTHAELTKEITSLQTGLESLNNEHQLAAQALEEWTSQWQILTEGFGLQFNAAPSEVTHFIDGIRELLSKQNEAEKLQIRIQAIDRDAVLFHSVVTRMIKDIAPELADFPTDNVVMRLHALLSDNRSKLMQHQQIKAQVEQLQQDIGEAQSTIQSMTDTLDALCVEAQCHEYTELEQAELKYAQQLNLKASIFALEQEVLETGEGASISVLETETASLDPDTLPGRIEALINTIDELEPRRTKLAGMRGREERELEMMDGSDHVATLTDQAQAILASIRSDTERYARVKLASRVLRDQIEAYRQANQGPLVKRASKHFAALTLDSFTGLMTDFNEKDQPVLVGIRLKGERVTVEGMSSGTRDQLYLALRLASLEKYMESAEPMPFIVDDVLLEFDDRRSEAALKALVTLTEKTQVILFTHHSRLVEQASKLSVLVQVHEL